MRELIYYEEYDTVYSRPENAPFYDAVTSKTVRVYPPEKGG